MLGIIFLKFVGQVSAYTICGREAALLGSVAAAANNLMFNLGIATTQVLGRMVRA
jgi:hypothetical protein